MQVGSCGNSHSLASNFAGPVRWGWNSSRLFRHLAGAISDLPVFEAPILHVDGEDVFIHEAASERSFGIRSLNQIRETGKQVLPQLSRDKIAVGGIDVAK